MMTDDGASMAADVAIQTAQGLLPREAIRIPILGREPTSLEVNDAEGDAHGQGTLNDF